MDDERPVKILKNITITSISVVNTQTGELILEFDYTEKEKDDAEV